MRSLGLRTLACLAVAALAGGCAAANVPHQTLSERFVHRGDPDAAPVMEFNLGELLSAETLPADLKVQLSELMAKPPPPREASLTVERHDPGLRAALLALTLDPSTENHRRLGEAYMRLGVLDNAYDQYKAALQLTRNDPASYDGLARIWRDWGFPSLGLGDVYRAIYYAPKSPIARNTLGTLLLRMGRLADAQSAFEHALTLDPGAAYARENLCRVLAAQGEGCREAR